MLTYNKNYFTIEIVVIKVIIGESKMPAHYSCNGHILISNPNKVSGTNVFSCLDKYYVDDEGQYLTPISFSLGKHEENCVAYRYVKHSPCGRTKYLLPCMYRQEGDDSEEPYICWLKVYAPHKGIVRRVGSQGIEDENSTFPELDEMLEFLLLNSGIGSEKIIDEAKQAYSELHSDTPLSLDEDELETKEIRINNQFIPGYISTPIDSPEKKYGKNSEEESLIVVHPMRAVRTVGNIELLEGKDVNVLQAYYKLQKLIERIHQNDNIVEIKCFPTSSSSIIQKRCAMVASNIASRYQLIGEETTEGSVTLKTPPAVAPTSGVFKPAVPPKPVKKPPIPPKPVLKPLTPKSGATTATTSSTSYKPTYSSTSKTTQVKGGLKKAGKTVGKASTKAGTTAQKQFRKVLHSEEGRELKSFAGSVARESAATATAMATQAIIEETKNALMYILRQTKKKANSLANKAKGKATRKTPPSSKVIEEDEEVFEDDDDVYSPEDSGETEEKVKWAIGMKFIGVEYSSEEEKERLENAPKFYYYQRCRGSCTAPLVASIDKAHYKKQKKLTKTIGRHLSPHLVDIMLNNSRLKSSN